MSCDAEDVTFLFRKFWLLNHAFRFLSRTFKFLSRTFCLCVASQLALESRRGFGCWIGHFGFYIVHFGFLNRSCWLLKRVFLIVEAVDDPYSFHSFHSRHSLGFSACPVASRLLGLSGGFSASRLLGFSACPVASWLLGFSACPAASRLLGLSGGFLASRLLGLPGGFLASRLVSYLFRTSRLLGFSACFVLLGFSASQLLGSSACFVLLGFSASPVVSRLLGFWSHFWAPFTRALQIVWKGYESCGGQLCVRELCVRELCVSEGCVRECVWDLWRLCVCERFVCEKVCVSSVEMVEERLCERATSMCERVVCERVVCEIVVWHVWPKTVAPRQLRQVPCLPHRMKVDVAKRHAFTQNGRRCFQMLHLPHKQPMSPSARPATQNPRRCFQMPHLPHKQPRRQREPSAPPEPAQCHKCHTCHTKWSPMPPSAVVRERIVCVWDGRRWKATDGTDHGRECTTKNKNPTDVGNKQ